MQTITYEIKGKDASGKGYPTEDGFLVLEGSLARKDIVPSAQTTIPGVHKRLLAEGVVEELGDQLRFLSDYEFDSPSGAAAAVLGRTSNGWQDWKNADGLSLSKVLRVSRDESVPLLDDTLRKRLIDQYQTLVNDGKLRTMQELAKEYALFRERFGPSVLKNLNGEALLNLIHNHGDKDSLVYWLEFKNDEEFETKRFGSIAGGSALKFRIFRRKETGTWQAGNQKGKPQDISTEEAILYAESHRDQLLAGCKLLDSLSVDASDEDYAQLQDELSELAPDVSRLAWGHKYFSLIYSEKLDDYHSPVYQRFHLMKLSQVPPEGDGRYICAGRFVTLTKELELPMNHLTATLNAFNGSVHRYWRVGTTAYSSGESFWEMMREQNRVAVGWRDLGDISWVERNAESREKLRELLTELDPEQTPSVIGRDCSQLIHFVADVAEGDVVLAANGMTILGIGKVAGGYEYHPEFGFPHQRKVEWLAFEEWKMPQPKEGLQSTIREIKKHNENIVAIERRIATADPITVDPKPTPSKPIRLPGIVGRIQSVVERKGQVILYGPPGTGKTYWADKAAKDLAAVSTYGRTFDSLDEKQKHVIQGNGQSSGLVRLCCFHPAYGYEDFIEGYRPHPVDGQLTFELRSGIFKRLCEEAREAPEQNYYLIIDEINRGDIPRIFGELLTILEKDKRGKQAILPVSQECFTVPSNVFVIGTMNTADRSISLLDAALRRRFGFIEMMPDGTVLKDSAVSGIPLRAWFDALNTRIRDHVGRDARNLQIGHSYLLQSGSPVKDLASLKRAIRDDIIPLLEEYCYEDYSTLKLILGDQLVDATAQRVCHELFDDGQDSDLIQALLAPCPEITASSEAVALEGSLLQDDVDDDEENEVNEDSKK